MTPIPQEYDWFREYMDGLDGRLDRIEVRLQTMDEKREDARVEMTGEISALKAKAGIWGGISGMVAGAVAGIGSLLVPK